MRNSLASIVLILIMLLVTIPFFAVAFYLILIWNIPLTYFAETIVIFVLGLAGLAFGKGWLFEAIKDMRNGK
jgi:pilus assembly protein TadC